MQDDEIIFMLTPHVVRATDITPLNLQEIDTGTGTNVELRRISAPANAQPGGVGSLPPGLQPHPAAAARWHSTSCIRSATSCHSPCIGIREPAGHSAGGCAKGRQHLPGRSQPEWRPGCLLGADAAALRQQQAGIDQRR